MIAVAAFLLPVVPLLALVAFLLAGRYPGLEPIIRLSERIAARARRRAVAPTPRQPGWPPTRAASGGLLLACGLSGRAPPASPLI